MLGIFKRQNGLTIVGQGGKIILFSLPFIFGAIAMHNYFPEIAVLKIQSFLFAPLAYIFMVCGILLWGTAMFQLLTAFSKNVLVTSGAYGIVRNPIYASVILLIMPSVFFLTLAWPYLIVSIAMFVGVTIFIKNEEEKLKIAFGKDYVQYLKRVDRLIPFVKPRQGGQ
jgi:protein-S-isoprenylcysteine O-methyltransferase Ste14